MDKATVRKIDKLGRVVLPKEMREYLDIDVKQPVEIFMSEGCAVIRKSRDECILCGSGEQLVEYKEKHVCRCCIDEL